MTTASTERPSDPASAFAEWLGVQLGGVDPYTAPVAEVNIPRAPIPNPMQGNFGGRGEPVGPDPAYAARQLFIEGVQEVLRNPLRNEGGWHELPKYI
jgi:hypothetical protein